MDVFIENLMSLFNFIVESVLGVVTIVTETPALAVMTFGLIICGAIFGYTSRLIKGR